MLYCQKTGPGIGPVLGDLEPELAQNQRALDPGMARNGNHCNRHWLGIGVQL